MEKGQIKPFSGAIRMFLDRSMYEAAVPVGHAAVIDAYELPVPVLNALSAIGPRHKGYKAES